MATIFNSITSNMSYIMRIEDGSTFWDVRVSARTLDEARYIVQQRYKSYLKWDWRGSVGFVSIGSQQ